MSVSPQTPNKLIVQKTKDALKALGYDISTGHVYEVLSQLAGHKSWSVAKAKDAQFEPLLCHSDGIAREIALYSGATSRKPLSVAMGGLDVWQMLTSRNFQEFPLIHTGGVTPASSWHFLLSALASRFKISDTTYAGDTVGHYGSNEKPGDDSQFYVQFNMPHNGEILTVRMYERDLNYHMDSEGNHYLSAELYEKEPKTETHLGYVWLKGPQELLTLNYNDPYMSPRDVVWFACDIMTVHAEMVEAHK